VELPGSPNVDWLDECANPANFGKTFRNATLQQPRNPNFFFKVPGLESGIPCDFYWVATQNF